MLSAFPLRSHGAVLPSPANDRERLTDKVTIISIVANNVRHYTTLLFNQVRCLHYYSPHILR